MLRQGLRVQSRSSPACRKGRHQQLRTGRWMRRVGLAVGVRRGDDGAASSRDQATRLNQSRPRGPRDGRQQPAQRYVAARSRMRMCLFPSPYSVGEPRRQSAEAVLVTSPRTRRVYIRAGAGLWGARRHLAPAGASRLHDHIDNSGRRRGACGAAVSVVGWRTDTGVRGGLYGRPSVW